MDGHAPQPEAEIAPVEIHAHHVVEIPVGCGDEAEIAFHFAHFTDGAEAAQLQRPQDGRDRLGIMGAAGPVNIGLFGKKLGSFGHENSSF